MPQLQLETYPSQIFWLAITFISLLLIVWRVALPAISSVLQNRQHSIETDLDFADTLKGEAQELESEYTASLSDVRAKASEVIDSAIVDIKARSEKKHAELDVVLSEQLSKANASLLSSRDAALGEVSQVAVDLSAIIVDVLAGIKVDKGVAEKAVGSALRSQV